METGSSPQPEQPTISTAGGYEGSEVTGPREYIGHHKNTICQKKKKKGHAVTK